MKPLRLKNMIAGCLLAAGALPVWGQSGAPTLVIRIDDLGALHSVNEACIQTYRSGIARSVEVMPVAAWYPEAIKMLKENPGLDVGLHLVITSEWENVKWRPLTHCPSLTDENGYFYPMMFPNPAYPGQAIMEQKWNLKEIEQEFRAQIETTLKSIPQLSHLSGHMLSTGFSKEVNELVQRLAKEYNLPSIDRMDSSKDYRFTYIGYDGPKRTAEEKEASFIKALDKLQPGQRYLFLDHPALDNDEMKTVFHVGYEDVALDRQGVTDLLTSPRVRKAIEDKGIKLISINQLTKGLPRAAAAPKLDKAMNRYLDAVKKAGQDLHSIMIVQHGNVIAEEWMGEGKEDEPHILNSVSKTFTATAVGLAASEGRLNLTDKVISFFPDKLPATVSENLAAMTVRDLLTMNCGHDTDPTGTVRKKADADWVQEFLAFPVEHKPGTFYTYNSLGTYMLSAIVQKVTGEKVVDYLYPRLFRPLGIVNARWQESPQGINTGGWGLYLKTEDLAKMGQLFLQKGNWNGQQILPEEWVKEASACQVPSLPAGMKPEMLKKAKTVTVLDPDPMVRKKMLLPRLTQKLMKIHLSLVEAAKENLPAHLWGKEKQCRAVAPEVANSRYPVAKKVEFLCARRQVFPILPVEPLNMTTIISERCTTVLPLISSAYWKKWRKKLLVSSWRMSVFENSTMLPKIFPTGTCMRVYR